MLVLGHDGVPATVPVLGQDGGPEGEACEPNLHTLNLAPSPAGSELGTVVHAPQLSHNDRTNNPSLVVVHESSMAASIPTSPVSFKEKLAKSLPSQVRIPAAYAPG
jgi:hypothetical protein